MIDWKSPETWSVGEEIDAELLNRRIRDQIGLLLRKPITVVHGTSNITVPTATNTFITYNVVDFDDDGMCQTATPVDTFYAQRAGIYQIYATADWLSTAVGSRVGIEVWGASAGYGWRDNTKITSTAGRTFSTSMSGELYLDIGEQFSINAWQHTGANMTLQAGTNTPRLCIAWLGP